MTLPLVEDKTDKKNQEWFTLFIVTNKHKEKNRELQAKFSLCFIFPISFVTVPFPSLIRGSEYQSMSIYYVSKDQMYPSALSPVLRWEKLGRLVFCAELEVSYPRLSCPAPCPIPGQESKVNLEIWSQNFWPVQAKLKTQPDTTTNNILPGDLFLVA